MGSKYSIAFMRNGTCKMAPFTWCTDSLARALWWLFRVRFIMKYKIVDLCIRAGHTPCEECDVDYCDKSRARKEV